jgi:hypothetical protein
VHAARISTGCYCCTRILLASLVDRDYQALDLSAGPIQLQIRSDQPAADQIMNE